MSIGLFLDRAAGALAEASDRLAAGSHDPHSVTTALTAREYVYRELGQFLRASGVRFPATQPSVADAVSLMARGSHVDPKARVAAFVRAAGLGLDLPRRELLAAPGSISEALNRAATNLSMATEIIHTHWSPPRHHGIDPQGQFAIAGSTSRPMTRQGIALYRGAEHDAVVAETAALARQAHAIDRDLRRLRNIAPDAVTAQQWEQLRTFALNRRIPAALDDLATAPHGNLLRQLAPAEPVERSNGPRPVQSWDDVHVTVETVRNTLRRDPHQATLALTAETARLGFAVTAGAWRLQSAGTPSERTQAVASQWRQLAGELTKYADLRDNVGIPLVTEVQMANQWVRQHCTAHTGRGSATDIAHAHQAEQQLGELCRALAPQLDRAAVHGDIMTPRGSVILRSDAAGIQHLTVAPNWVQTPQVALVEHRLRTVNEIITGRPEPGTQHEPAPAGPAPAAGQTHAAGASQTVPAPAPIAEPAEPTRDERAPGSAARVLTEQAARDAGHLALSRAWPSQVGRALYDHTMRPKDTARAKPAAGQHEQPGREERQR